MITINVASANDVKFCNEISNLIEIAAKERGTGIAKRTPYYLAEKILSGKAIIAKADNNKLIGFCYIESWGHQDFVATSGLIVRDDFRGIGISRKIKEKAFELSRKKFPDAKLFSITTNIAVLKLNLEMGYKAVNLFELTNDNEFWECCKTCVNYPILQETNRTHCLCTGLLFDPKNQTNDNKETLNYKVYARWFKYKFQVLSKILKPKKAIKKVKEMTFMI